MAAPSTNVTAPICPITFEEVDEACPHCWDDGSMKVPISTVDEVRKDECCYCCNTNRRHEGIFICMKCFQGVCGEHLQQHYSNHQHPLYIRLWQKPRELKKGPPAKFEDVGKEEEPEFEAKMVCVPCKQAHIDGIGNTCDCMMGIMTATAPRVVDALTEDTWLMKVECPHGIMVPQEEKLAFTPANPPSSAPECSVPGCGVTTNNWLCLTCGAVGCARAEAGGKGHALQHFLNTGHPLVVKLGTITPKGADVHCYSCENEVLIGSKLPEFLFNLGIDMSKCVKTSKSLAEMMMDHTLKYDLFKITEEGSELQHVGGAGVTGIQNLGNSCYMNSVLQVIFSVPQFVQRYYSKDHRKNCKASKPQECFDCQFEKVAEGLLSGDFSQFPSNDEAKMNYDDISPRDFKKVVAQKHKDFSTGQQQDAAEYFGWLLQQVSRREALAGHADTSPTRAFEFLHEKRTQCSVCQGVKYEFEQRPLLQLPVPVQPFEPPLGNDGKPVKQTDAEIEASRPRTSLDECISTFMLPSFIDCRCSKCGNPTQYTETAKLNTFPDVLGIQARREYFCKKTYEVKKLDVFIDVPEELDLERLRGSGPQTGETIWETKTISASGASASAAAPEDDEKPVDEVALATLLSMDLDARTAKWGLRETNNNVERALDYIFSHPEGPPAAKAPTEPSKIAAAVAVKPSDGPAKYELFALVSHIGRSASTGHYVCHVKKEGKWVLFNDEKVAYSKNPPKEFAFVYFYKRK